MLWLCDTIERNELTRKHKMNHGSASKTEIASNKSSF